MAKGKDLWTSDDVAVWRDALASYAAVIDAQGSAALSALDRWYRDEFPAAITARAPRYCTHEELVRLTEWKMTRGVWRARNLQLVKGNDADLVATTSADAIAAMPDARTPIKLLASLEGVGPATASAVCAAAEPGRYPFFDEVVAVCVPSLGAVDFTLAYYVKYADALRARAVALGDGFTPVMVERAVFAAQGGKKGWKS